MATIEVTADNFQETVENNEVVLLDFWAERCGPCRSFAPVFEAAATEHEGIVFGKIDTETQQELAASFSITSIPTLVAIRDRIVVFAQPGALQAAQLEQVIDAVNELDMDDVRREIEAQQSPNGGEAEAGEL